ncbi:MAG: protein SCO1/2 [Verrucomicrobiales bacterium]|jgi:protein SCO1/2
MKRFSQILMFGLALMTLPVSAQMPAPGSPLDGGAQTPAGQMPAGLEDVGFDQNLGTQVDLDLEFTDSTGKKVRLGDYFGDKPVILSFAYYECPMLCTMELNGLIKALRVITRFQPGEDFEIVTLSFDSGETPEIAAEKKKGYLETYRREGAEDAWHFLVGEESQIRALADAVGFRYSYDEETDLYRHASGIVTLTADGRASRYQFGVEYSGRDLQFALIDASDNSIGSLADAAMLYCFHYDVTTGKYGLVVMNAVRLGGALTVLLLGSFMVVNFLRDRRRERATA